MSTDETDRQKTGDAPDEQSDLDAKEADEAAEGNTEQVEQATVEAADIEQPEIMEPDEPPTSEKPAPGRGVSFLALFLSLVAISAVGFVLWQDFRAASAADDSADSLSRLGARLDASRETIVSLQNRIAEQAEKNDSASDRLAQLESTLSDPQRLLGSLPARTSSLERSLSALQGVSAGTRDNWLLAEAEYFMQIANAQLQLANNPELAATALRQADERIADLSNPAYTEVRAAIANELAALDLMNSADVAGLTMTLASLSHVVDSLPIKMNEAAGEKLADGDISDDMGRAERAWASVKQAMAGLVKVTKPDEDGSPLLTPDAEILLRANLSLQLQAARLALLKGEREVFEQSLIDAENWMMTYFDIRSVQVGSALETITEIRNSPAMDNLPDISESLQLLRQIRVLDENSQ